MVTAFDSYRIRIGSYPGLFVVRVLCTGVRLCIEIILSASTGSFCPDAFVEIERNGT